MTTVHHCFGTDLASGLAAEEWQEWHWENRKIGAGRRADVQVDRAWCVSCTVDIVITHSVRSGPKPMHYGIYAL